jgi:DNA-binding FadR family transcriptional regulator
MMKAGTYPRRGLHGAVVHDIGVRILRGDLGPGDALPTEEELGEPGVSRTVLREAVKVLAAKRLVESRPKTGTRVLPRSEWNLLDPDVLAWRLEASPDAQFFADLIELRRLIEPEASALAATRATEDEVSELERMLARMEASVEDSDAYLEPDLRFHAIILEGCHNELLEQMGKVLRGVFRALFVRVSEARATRARALPLHAAIVEAIRAHDPDAAERATRVLIDDTAASLSPSRDGAGARPR